MIRPEAIEGLTMYPLTPEYVSLEGASQEAPREGKRKPKEIAAAAFERVRHHWGLTLPRDIDAETREGLLAARELEAVQAESGTGVEIYRKGVIPGTVRRAPGILSTTDQGDRFQDEADFKESTTRVITHPTLVVRFLRRTPDTYYAADLRGTEYENKPPKRMRRPKG